MIVVRAPRAAAAFALLALASCTSGQVGQLTIDPTNVITDTKLQFNVGWVTTYAPLFYLTADSYGLNFVETFRQANGRSAVQTDSAAINFPQTLNAQLNALGETLDIHFPAPIAALGAGINNGTSSIAPANLSYQPDVGTGGPPAFPAPADSTSLTSTFYEGYYADFPSIPPNQSAYIGAPLTEAEKYFPGTYTLNVTIPTGQTSTVTKSATATLSGTPLPAFAEPSIALDGTGGGLVTVTIPAGVTETLVSILTYACTTTVASPSPGASPSAVVSIPQLYTLISHVAGPATDRLTLPDYIAPNGSSAPYRSICAAADFPGQGTSNLYATGFDYPAFESVYPQNFSETPTITGSGGRSDITISAPVPFKSV